MMMLRPVTLVTVALLLSYVSIAAGIAPGDSAALQLAPFSLLSGVSAWPGGASSRTFSAWIYILSTASGTDQTILQFISNAKTCDNSQLLWFYQASTQTIVASTSCGGSVSNAPQTVTTGIWTYAAFTYASGTGIAYVGGNAATGSWTVTLATSLDIVFIGINAAANIGASPFDGYMDEIHVYGAALTFAQLGTDMNNAAGAVSGLVSAFSGALNGGGSLLDSVSGSPASGTPLTTATATPSPRGGAYYIVNYQYASLQSTTNIPSGNAARTLSAWAYPYVINFDTIIFSFDDTALDCGSTVLVFGFLAHGQIYTGVCNVGSLATSTYLTVGQWAHLALTYSPVGNAIVLYVNGVQVGTNSISLATSTQVSVIGIRKVNGQTIDPFIGLLEEIHMYNTALASTDIERDMNEAAGSVAGLVLRYDMTASGGALVDTINGNNGLLVGSPELTANVQIQGDPQFAGFCSQSYQVHGISGNVYSLISTASLQLNAKFAFLDRPKEAHGEASSPRRAASLSAATRATLRFSHPGTYITALGLLFRGVRLTETESRMSAHCAAPGVHAAPEDEITITTPRRELEAAGANTLHRLVVEAGDFDSGFKSLSLDGTALSVGDSLVFRSELTATGAAESRSHSGWKCTRVIFASVSEFSVLTNAFSLHFVNSDRFINLREATVRETEIVRVESASAAHARFPTAAGSAKVKSDDLQSRECGTDDTLIDTGADASDRSRCWRTFRSKSGTGTASDSAAVLESVHGLLGSSVWCAAHRSGRIDVGTVDDYSDGDNSLIGASSAFNRF
jgi:hypothetical protein